MLDRVADGSEYLSVEEKVEDLTTIRQHARTGRPIGDEAFVDYLEALTGRKLK